MKDEKNILNWQCDDNLLQNEVYKKMSYAERWGQAVKLREMAWMIKKASVREKHPDWNEDQVQKEVSEIFLYASK